MSQVDYFLKLEGIDGESQDKKLPNTIQIFNFSWGASQAGSFGVGSGGGAGKVQFQDFHFTKQEDKSSPKLFDACASGKHIPSAKLTVRRAGGEQEVSSEYSFKDLLVSSFTKSGSGELPIESISFNFTAVKAEYFMQNQQGKTVSVGDGKWDTKKNAASF